MEIRNQLRNSPDVRRAPVLYSRGHHSDTAHTHSRDGGAPMIAFTYGQQRADNLRGSGSATHKSALSDAVCYDLFRRAIEQRDDDAWADIGRHYRGLLAAWAAQSSARSLIAEQPEDIADQAFARAWAALSSAHFSAFP